MKAQGYLNPCTPSSFSDSKPHELPPKLFLTRNFERQLMNQTKNKKQTTLDIELGSEFAACTVVISAAIRAIN